MSIGLLGQKIGMTSVYDAKGRLCPVTVIAAGDNVLLRRLTADSEGYSAVQVGFAAHGSKTHRRIGAVGNRSTPGRIWKNQGMPGHMGDRRVTVQNLQVMQVREAEKIILVSGAVPGANGTYVVVRPAVKHPERVLALHAEHRKHEEEEKAKKPKTIAELAQKK